MKKLARVLVRRVGHHDDLPQPPGSAPLARLRVRVAQDLRREFASEIGSTQDDPPAAGRLAERLVRLLRRRVVGEARGPAQRAAAWLDQRLISDRIEMMDRAELPSALRERIVLDVDRIHQLLGSYDRFFDVAAPALAGGGRVLDLASGHGGLAVAMALWAQRQGVDLRVTASDMQPAYLDLAGQAARRAGVHIDRLVLDARHPGGAPGPVDVVVCTHSLHHLGVAGTVELFGEACRIARRAVVLMDTWRAPEAALIAGGLFALTSGHGPSVHDAALSVRRAFVAEEVALALSCVSGGQRARVRWLPSGWWAAVVQP